MDRIMYRTLTIACARTSNNRGEPRTGVFLPLWCHSVLVLCGLVMAGCVSDSPRQAHIEIPSWELARAERVAPVLIGRTRVSYDRRLPARVTQPLSDLFTLVNIDREEDWDALRRSLGLGQPTEPMDLSKGSIVGILANVGEPADNVWPILLRTVRVKAGYGWVDAEFAPGLYYPLKTAGYLELAYVPGLRHVRTIRINHHTFRILPSSPLH